MSNQPLANAESYPNFRTLVERSPDIILYIDTHLRFTYANPAYQQFIGDPALLLLGRPVDEVGMVSDPALRLEYHQHLLQVFATGLERALGITMATLSGERVFAVRLIPDYAADGTISGVFTVLRDTTAQWQVEQSAERAAARNWALIEALPDAIMRIHRNGTYLEVKAPRSPDAHRPVTMPLVGQKVQELLPPEIAHSILEQHERALASREMQTLKTSLQIDGEVRYGESRVVPLNQHEVLVVIRDITQQKAAEQALQRSEEIVRQQLAEIETIYASAPVGLCALDKELRYIRINEALAALNNLPVADHIGRTPREILRPDLADWFEPMLQRVLASGEAVEQIELNRPAADDLHLNRAWLMSYFPLKDESGEVIGVNAVVADTSKLKQAELALQQLNSTLEALVQVRTDELQLANVALLARIAEHEEAELALRRSEERYRTLVEMMPDALFVSEGNRVVYANPACLRLLKITSPEQVLGRSPFDFLHPSNQKLVQQRVKRMLREVGISLVEAKVVRLDGTVIDVEFAASSYPDRARNDVQVIMRNITARKEAEEQRERLVVQLAAQHQQLQLLNRELASSQENTLRLVARELHDQVGQNLTALGINLTLLQEQLVRQRLDKTQIVRSFDDARTMVAQITATVREILLELRPPTLDELGLLATLRWYSGTMSRRVHLPITVFGEEPAPRLPEALALALFRITQEAVTNIVKHAQATQVDIHLWADAEGTHLTIEDNGRGFEATRTAQSGQHAHWGMINMQERAAAVEGQLTIESQPGQGTYIQVDIPR